ncbi:hypothetical protein [Roseibium sediminicola]|uniref:Uncharacterized protein n=1 Tax=Roseibium sediminicola TaxID=2933272 RepID=A0ABT0GPS1_9HYPH|nr:hypothetical protein [Roseibium sp. CAU 1639]MCK7611423.1 hypothetical protein [Roseibium sp. CAU 1639]
MKPFLTICSLALMSVQAFAHPGVHDEITGWTSASEHFLGSPFHVVVIVAALGAGFAALAVRRSFAAKAKQTKN